MNKLNHKIRAMREINQWSQEEMAEKLHMSLNGYAKIERGESKLTLEKLEQIANLFNMDALELMQTAQKGVYFMMNESADNNYVNYYGTDDSLIIENEKLKLSLSYQEKIITQKDAEISALKEVIALFKTK